MNPERERIPDGKSRPACRVDVTTARFRSPLAGIPSGGGRPQQPGVPSVTAWPGKHKVFEPETELVLQGISVAQDKPRCRSRPSSRARTRFGRSRNALRKRLGRGDPDVSSAISSLSRGGWPVASRFPETPAAKTNATRRSRLGSASCLSRLRNADDEAFTLFANHSTFSCLHTVAFRHRVVQSENSNWLIGGCLPRLA